ncbi:MAG: hypothetical protein EOP58_08475 [Sphingomonadales bacterium]|nr:MAG: hypothetical protein EOP58_08475 [Sphingomonadales bacterium]
MIRRHIFMSAAAATIMLSSCNGGDDSNPTPTPTPTASPTPTPTASPTYAAFPLAGAAEFFTINGTTSFTGDPATSAVTLGTTVTEARSDRVRLATSNAPTTGIYVFRDAAEESRFAAVAPTTPSAAGNTEFVFRSDSTTTAGLFSQIEFLNNTIPSTVTSDPLLSTLTRVSYANWYRGDSTAGAKRLTYGVFGYATALTDLPTTGTQAYTVYVTGRLISTSGATTSINKVGGTVTVSVNFSTGQVDLGFNLTQTVGGVATPYATFNAQAALPAAQNQFNGSFTTGGPLTGTVVGGFFGSRGAEIGITFAGFAAGQRLVGEIVGKKTP